MVEKASFLTINEKRKELGFDVVGDEGNVILIPSTMIPLDTAGITEEEVDETEEEVEVEIEEEVQEVLFEEKRLRAVGSDD